MLVALRGSVVDGMGGARVMHAVASKRMAHVAGMGHGDNLCFLLSSKMWGGGLVCGCV